jgi:hypothetical protein
VRAAGLAAVLLFLGLVARFWHPVYGFTAFLQLDASNDDTKIAAFRAMPVYVYRDTGGYDGLYYAQIAYHPSLAAAELRPAIDGVAYRGRRILAPLLAWALAFGNPAWIVHVYSVLNVAAFLVLAAWLWRLLAVSDARGWLAWAGLLFSAGALCSVRYAVPDLLALTILAGAMLALERGRLGVALGALAVAGLARETSLAALPASWKRPWFSWRNLAAALVVVAPLAAWIGYVRWRVGPGGVGDRNLAWPVTGWIEKWLATFAAMRTEGDLLPVWTTLLATLALTVQAVYFLKSPRLEDRWWRAGAGFVALLFCLGPAVWSGFPGAATRVLLPMNLAFNVLVHRARAPLAWLLAGNLTVAAGLLALKDVPRDPNELAAARARGSACIATLRDGWYGRERSSEQTWAWCPGRCTIAFEAWPKDAHVPRLEFALRSLAPRTVILSQAGRELWRGSVGAQLTPRQSVPVQLAAGRASLEFATDTPAARENGNADARLLAFALYDARLVVPKR